MQKLDESKQLCLEFERACDDAQQLIQLEPAAQKATTIIDFRQAMTRRHQERQKESERHLLQSIHDSIKHLG